jgi:hypothetical protein
MTPKPKDVLADLIERLKQATEGSEQLNCDIFRAIGAPLPSEFMGRDITLEYNETEHCYLMPIGDQRIRYTPPRFTESLDTAMTLVPDGWSWHLSGGDLSVEGKPYACIASNELSGGPAPWLEEREVKEATAATPAIALCIAALTAISNGAEHG